MVNFFRLAVNNSRRRPNRKRNTSPTSPIHRQTVYANGWNRLRSSFSFSKIYLLIFAWRGAGQYWGTRKRGNCHKSRRTQITSLATRLLLRLKANTSSKSRKKCKKKKNKARKFSQRRAHLGDTLVLLPSTRYSDAWWHWYYTVTFVETNLFKIRFVSI